MKSQLETDVESLLASKFPGLKSKFTFNFETLEWSLVLLDDSEKDFCHLYPGVSKEDADKALLNDVRDLINYFLIDYGFMVTEMNSND